MPDHEEQKPDCPGLKRAHLQQGGVGAGAYVGPGGGRGSPCTPCGRAGPAQHRGRPESQAPPAGTWPSSRALGRDRTWAWGQGEGVGAGRGREGRARAWGQDAGAARALDPGTGARGLSPTAAANRAKGARLPRAVWSEAPAPSGPRKRQPDTAAHGTGAGGGEWFQGFKHAQVVVAYWIHF